MNQYQDLVKDENETKSESVTRDDYDENERIRIFLLSLLSLQPVGDQNERKIDFSCWMQKKIVKINRNRV